MTPWKEALEQVAKAITESYSAGEFGIVASAERVIESLSQAGYVVVPREPNRTMSLEGCKIRSGESVPTYRQYPSILIYRAMITAWEKERDTK